MTVSTDNRPVLVIRGAAVWSVRLVGGGDVIGVEADGMSTGARKFPSQIFEKIITNVLRCSAPHFGPCVSVKKCDDGHLIVTGWMEHGMIDPAMIPTSNHNGFVCKTK